MCQRKSNLDSLRLPTAVKSILLLLLPDSAAGFRNGSGGHSLECSRASPALQLDPVRIVDEKGPHVRVRSPLPAETKVGQNAGSGGGVILNVDRPPTSRDGESPFSTSRW